MGTASSVAGNAASSLCAPGTGLGIAPLWTSVLGPWRGLGWGSAPLSGVEVAWPGQWAARARSEDRSLIFGAMGGGGGGGGGSQVKAGRHILFRPMH